MSFPLQLVSNLTRNMLLAPLVLSHLKRSLTEWLLLAEELLDLNLVVFMQDSELKLLSFNTPIVFAPSLIWNLVKLSTSH